jgi:hypothetical protein
LSDISKSALLTEPELQDDIPEPPNSGRKKDLLSLPDHPLPLPTQVTIEQFRASRCGPSRTSRGYTMPKAAAAQGIGTITDTITITPEERVRSVNRVWSEKEVTGHYEVSGNRDRSYLTRFELLTRAD